MAWKTYRMYRCTMTACSHGGSGYFDGNRANNFLSTAITFRGRNHEEATKKMDKFIRNSRVVGSFFIKEMK